MYSLGQSTSPAAAWPRSFVKSLTRVYDFTTGSMRDEMVRMPAETLPIGGTLDVGGYHLVLETVGPVAGPNYDADQALIRASKAGRPVCTGRPERRVYPAGGQTTSEVAICYRGFSHLYMVLGERRESPAGKSGPPVWLVVKRVRSGPTHVHERGPWRRGERKPNLLARSALILTWIAPIEIVVRQRNLQRDAVLLGMPGRTGFRDSDHAVVSQYPGQGDLRRRGGIFRGNAP